MDNQRERSVTEDATSIEPADNNLLSSVSVSQSRTYTQERPQLVSLELITIDEVRLRGSNAALLGDQVAGQG